MAGLMEEESVIMTLGQSQNVAKLPGENPSLTYWASPEGQERIEAFDGWKDSTNLSSWLAQSQPRLYGREAGLNNLWGQKNRGIAAFAFVTEMMQGPDSEASRKLADALNEYARLA